MWDNLIYKPQAHLLGHQDHSCSIKRPLKGQRGRDHFPACSKSSGPRWTAFFSFLLCLFSCVRPHGICHLSSVKFSCKVSQCVVSGNQHAEFSGCSQITFSKSINMLVSQEASGSLLGKAHPFLGNRYEAGSLLEAEAPDKLHLL